MSTAEYIQHGLDYLRRRKQAYTSVFGVPGTAGHIALKDLARFCRAFHFEDADTYNHDRALIVQGRREVFFRILSHLKLQPDELAALYKATVLKDQGEI